MQWKLFADLAELAGDKEISVDAESGDTVEDALSDLLEPRPELENRVLDDDGHLRDHINVLRNGTNVFSEEGLETELESGDELALFPPVSGG
ncbi:ubiquitin-like small modifier protein 1 [Haladaptatus cibarius]|uniref:ubiquitin-like small modifier protein 1 n=1 Tax=Haladaptatus cibarius TaxID=453847 RepID=UPI000679D11B|nr:ubiquitin-like small modifier protein 1 [Haladaptatus cibarius]